MNKIMFALISTFCFISIQGLRIRNFRLNNDLGKQLLRSISVFSTSVAFMTGMVAPHDVLAVSGGGKDFANKVLREETFEGQTWISKDFTQVDAAGVNFRNSILKGSRFYKANLSKADFTGSDLSSASLEDTSLQGAKFDNAILQGAYFSASISDAESLAGADFTDALVPELTLKKLCDRSDIVSKNPKTGAVTSDSLMCP